MESKTELESSDQTIAPDTPTVVAVVVVSDPGDRLDECLKSIEDQDYEAMSILVIDAGSESPVTDRVASLVPDAFVHRLGNNPGLAAARNLAIELVKENDFFLFCDDDVALDERAVSVMLEEAYRSNAAIVGPKLVNWNRPRVLSQIGMGSDRFGVQVDLIEPGDFDQQQYDTVRDTFIVPAAVQLVRGDLFRALGGYDDAQADYGFDLDLCWRAQVAGARVIVVPTAVARHANEELASNLVAKRRKELARGRLRTQLVATTGLSRFLHLVAAVLLVVVEAVFALFSGRGRYGLDLLSGLAWNVSRVAEIRERRKQLGELRKTQDRDIRAVQVSGSARLSSFFRERFGSQGDRMAGFFGQVKNSLDADDAGIFRDGLILIFLIAVILLFGSRHLLTRPIDMIGLGPDVSDGRGLLAEWWGGWRSAGLGGEGNAPTAFLVLALAKFLLLGSERLLNMTLMVGPLVIGTVWMWRLVRPFGSQRAAGVSTLMYLSTPLLGPIMANGRWDALVIWSAMPILLGSLYRLIGNEPFGSRHPSAGSGVVSRPFSVRLVRWGLLVFFVSIFVPAVVVLAVLMCLVAAPMSVMLARPSNVAKLAVGAVAAVFVPVALNMPWSFDLASKASWNWIVGPQSPYTSFDSMADLLRFAPGPSDPNTLAVALLVAAGVVLVVGRNHRFDAGALGWALAAASFLLVWADRRGWVPFVIPAPEIMLVLPAAAISTSVGVAVRSVESDLAAFRFGWRQATAIVGAVSIIVFTFLGLTASLNGRWSLPTNGYGPTIAALKSNQEGSTNRTLWIGDPGVMPIDTVVSPGGVSYAVTDGASLDAIYRWSPGHYGATDQVGLLLDQATSRETVRLGRQLSRYGIDQVIVVPVIAPAPFVGETVLAGSGIEDSLANQLDLRKVSGVPPLTLFLNVASRGPAVSLEETSVPKTATASDIVNSELASAQPVALEVHPGGVWSGELTDEKLVVVATPGEGWRLEGARDSLTTGLGGQLVIEPGPAGPIELTRPRAAGRQAMLLLELALIGAGIQIARMKRGSLR